MVIRNGRLKYKGSKAEGSKALREVDLFGRFLFGALSLKMLITHYSLLITHDL
ncbi:MAG: hypothetical protein F6K47_43810 [Symploca sp. SIO2E6]|nr:hypothetical protein [Symploca sp. SIO2E6]